MKKFVALVLLLCMVLTLAACAKMSVSMQEIYDATQTEAMLKNHQSVSIRDKIDGELFNERYLTKEYIFDYVPNAESDWAEFVTDNSCYSYLGGAYVRYLPITPDGVSDGFASYRAEHYASVILDAETVDEVITSVSKKDGRFYAKSVLSQKILESMAEFGVTSGNFEYVLDAKTREILSIEGNYTYNDDSTHQMTSEISYDAEVPEMVKTFLEYANQTENLRTITVVTNPGTDKEVSQSVQVPKDLLVGLRYYEDSEYTFEVYTDAACTEAYDPYADAASDLTIYVKWFH
jgi:hypothetical protein